MGLKLLALGEKKLSGMDGGSRAGSCAIPKNCRFNKKTEKR